MESSIENNNCDNLVNDEIINALKNTELNDHDHHTDEEGQNKDENLSNGDSLDSLDSNSSNDIIIKQSDAKCEIDKQEQEQPLDVLSPIQTSTTNTLIKRSHLKSLIHEIYDMNETTAKQNDEENLTDHEADNNSLIEGFMEKLPPRKNLKNSILLAWKKRYFKLSSIGMLTIHDFDDEQINSNPVETFNLMGARVVYEQNEVISIDDGRGNCVVFRCCNLEENNTCEQTKIEFSKWKSAIDSQIIDRSDSLWVRPNKPLSNRSSPIKGGGEEEQNVLIIDIGTCSIRAGLFDPTPQLPSLFVPTCCSKDPTNGNVKVGFDAFDTLLSSAAPSTIDLSKSTWSLTSNLNFSSSQLTFPLKNKAAIDKLNVDISSIDGIVSFVVESLNIVCQDYDILIITPQKFSDKLNVQFLNLLLENEKYQFKSVCLMNQSLLALYSYNSSIGVVANLGEKIDIVPICNGLSFQNGVTNLVYGGNTMSEYLNSFISRAHVNYVNDIEQYFVRYIKEKSCFTALCYKDELNKHSKDIKKYKIDLTNQNDTKSIEIPETARFTAVEGLFNPEIWGIDGQGIHKLIFKAIQSSSIDLRREMARSIYLCGGMSRIPGLKERLEKELKQMLPPSLTVKVNVSEHSYHCAYLGAFRFLQQPEYEKLQITRKEWSTENINCLRKWRMI